MNLKVNLPTVNLKSTFVVTPKPVDLGRPVDPFVASSPLRFAANYPDAAKLLLKSLRDFPPAGIMDGLAENPRFYPLIKDLPPQLANDVLVDKMRQLALCEPAEAIRDSIADPMVATTSNFWEAIRQGHPDEAVKKMTFRDNRKIKFCDGTIPYARLFYGTPILESTPEKLLNMAKPLQAMQVHALQLNWTTSKGLRVLVNNIRKNPALKKWFSGLQSLKIVPVSFPEENMTDYVSRLNTLLSYCPRLTHLDLSNDARRASLTAEHLRMLAPNFVRLRYLNLAHYNLVSAKEGQTGESGLTALISMPELGNLNYLGLAHNSLNTKDLSLFAQKSYLEQLTHLDLSGNTVQLPFGSYQMLLEEGFQAFINTPFLPRLTHLDLSDSVLISHA